MIAARINSLPLFFIALQKKAMYPKTLTTTVSCLEALVGIRTECSIAEEYPFYIEDIEGLDIKALAGVAKGTNLNGVDFARQLINSSAREMLGDIELLMNNGYKINNIVGSICSSCTLSASYLSNTGIIVKTLNKSIYSIIRITKLMVLVNVSGSKVIVIDDGVAPKTYTATFTAGILAPLNLNYSTNEKSVKIYFQDATVPLGLVSCSTSSSCGCGSKGTSQVQQDIVITGLLNGAENTNQYGFLPCVSLECSNEILLCTMIKQAPNIFGLTLLYKFGEKYYANKQVSHRTNETVSFNEEDQVESNKNYGQLYWAKMQGGKGRIAIKNIINDFLSTKRNDKCVVCDSKISTASVTG